MDVAFAKQKQAFDYLIDEDHTILHLSSGYQERDELSIKDSLLRSKRERDKIIST